MRVGLLLILVFCLAACENWTLMQYEKPPAIEDTVLVGYWISGDLDEWRTRLFVHLFSLPEPEHLYYQFWQVHPEGYVEDFWQGAVLKVGWEVDYLGNASANVLIDVDYPIDGKTWQYVVHLDTTNPSWMIMKYRPQGVDVELYRRWPDADGILYRWTYQGDEHAISLDLLAGPFLSREKVVL